MLDHKRLVAVAWLALTLVGFYGSAKVTDALNERLADVPGMGAPRLPKEASAALNASGLMGAPSNLVDFSVLDSNPFPAPPALVAPSNGTSQQLPVTLSWTHVPNHQDLGYQLQIETSSSFQELPATAPSTTPSVTASATSSGTGARKPASANSGM